MRLFRLFLLLTIILLATGYNPQSITAQSVSMFSSSAVSSFPAGVTFNVSGEPEDRIVKAELLYTRAEQSTLNLLTATVNPGPKLDLSLPVDFQTNYVPPGIEITFHWRLTDSRNQVTETELQRITWEDTRFTWDITSTDQVSVYSYSGNAEFAQTILNSAQSTIDRLQADFSVARSRPIRIWVYDSKSDFQGSQAPNSQEWIAGTAYPELQVILAVLPEGDEREVGRVVPHEISHQVLYQAARNPFNAPPTWFDEGLAVSAQKSGNETFQALVERAADEGRLFSVRSLTSEFPFDPADASLAYAESFSVVQFMVSQWGNAGVAAVINAYSGGVSHDDALLAAIGVDMDGLDQLWKASLGYDGDRGVAGGTETQTSGWTQSLLINATSFIIAVAVLLSVATMLWRRRNAVMDDEDEFNQVVARAW